MIENSIKREKGEDKKNTNVHKTSDKNIGDINRHTVASMDYVVYLRFLIMPIGCSQKVWVALHWEGT